MVKSPKRSVVSASNSEMNMMNNKMNPMNAIIGIILQAIVLSWVFKAEKCSCSVDWRRDYIKFYAIFAIIVTMYLTFNRIPTNPWFLFTIVVLSMINLYSILTYIPMLRAIKCTCATENDIRDDFIWWWKLISLSMGVLTFIIFFIVGVTLRLYGMGLNKH